MRFKTLVLLLLLSSSMFGQEKISIPGFGDLPIEKEGDMYAITFGSYKKLNFSGTINPLSLSTAVGMDDLKFVPGSHVLFLLGLQDIELTIQKEDFEIAANIEDQFKEKVFDQLRSLDGFSVIEPILGEVEKTFAIRDSKASIKLSTNADLYGTIDLSIYVLGAKLPIPTIKGEIAPEAIARTVAVKVKDVAVNEIAKVGKLVAAAAVKSMEITTDAYGKASEAIGTASQHAHADKTAENIWGVVKGDDVDWNASKKQCDKHCVPSLARKMYKPVLQGSYDGISNFYDTVLPSLANINGNNAEETKELREKFILEDWEKLIDGLNSDWADILEDKTYVGYYLNPTSAENGGNIFRDKIRNERAKYQEYRDHIWNRMLTYKKFETHHDNIYFIKSVSEGEWWDLAGHHQKAEGLRGKIGLYKKDNKNGKEGADRFIKVIPHQTNKKYVFLQPQHSDLVADVAGKSQDAGAELILWHKGENNTGQMFEMKPVEHKTNTYYLINANSGLYLTANGKGTITQENPTNKDNQRWKFEDAGNPDLMMSLSPNFKYGIENVKGRRYIDAPGAKRKTQTKGAKLTLWELDEWSDHYFKLSEKRVGGNSYYSMQPMHSENVVDISGRNTSNGTKVGLWSWDGKLNQQFEFIYAGSPNTYFIRDRNSDKFIDAEAPNVHKNGCPIVIWDFYGGENQKWKLHPYDLWQVPPSNQNFFIKAAYGDNNYWDVNDEKAGKGSKIGIWELDDGKDRIFRIVKSGDGLWMNIKSVRSGNLVDVPNNTDKNGTQLVLWEPNGGDNQKFAFEFTSPTSFVLRTKRWKSLSIKGNPAKGDDWLDNGRAVQLYDPEYNMDFHFQLIYADGPNAGKPYIFKEYGKEHDPNDHKEKSLAIEGKKFIIQSAQNYKKNNEGVWDCPGSDDPVKDGMNLGVWESDGGRDQIFVVKRGSVKGFYKLSPSHDTNYCVDVNDGKSENGTTLALWKDNNLGRKNFRFKHLGGGRFKIISYNGAVVTLEGRSSKNGSDVRVWEDQNGKWMEWYLLDPTTRKAYIP